MASRACPTEPWRLASFRLREVLRATGACPNEVRDTSLLQPLAWRRSRAHSEAGVVPLPRKRPTRACYWCSFGFFPFAERISASCASSAWMYAVCAATRSCSDGWFCSAAASTCGTCDGVVAPRLVLPERVSGSKRKIVIDWFASTATIGTLIVCCQRLESWLPCDATSAAIWFRR